MLGKTPAPPATAAAPATKSAPAPPASQPAADAAAGITVNGDSAWALKVATSPDFPRVARDDEHLAPFAGVLKSRFLKMRHWLDVASTNHGSLYAFAQGHKYFGFHDLPSGDVVYREYAPGAASAALVGDFNNWDSAAHRMTRNDFGVWSVTVPAGTLPHGSRVKIRFTSGAGETFDRISPWARRVVQDVSKSVAYESVYWNPPREQQYTFKHPRPPRPESLRIYEAHVGIASEEPKIGSYAEFTATVLPRVKTLGYNAIQLMAVQEHAYYASFGYQVTSFFAPSSRFGTPEDLMRLIDEAHALGIVVLLDLVHSHASKNVLDGLNMFDGTDHCYFHGGPLGWHSLWDSRLFNYGSYETLRFLLSNCAYWIEDYRFDGFRFDGVTSMLYTHHGIGYGFSGNYHEYFGPGLVDDDAVTYLMLANYLVHQLVPDTGVTIAEDVSGMPALCRPVADGGVGFDYRLGMAVPDMWIKLLKEFKDEDWDMGNVAHTLTNRRWNEATIGYAESHDQALVGDKTMAFWLMDKDMYDHMSEVYSQHPPPTIDRGMAMHKMIRLVTFGLGGEGYLCFMGNEFGHPEWLDFPRAGNGESYHYARRQWSLASDPTLRYRYLQQFDVAMLQLDRDFHILGPASCGRTYVSLKHEGDKVLAFERWSGDGKQHLLFVFNWHPTQSYTGYRIGVNRPGTYRVVLDSDAREFGGFARVDPTVDHIASADAPWNNRAASVQLYLPSRSATVFARVADDE
ncbi:alpha-1,4-glucan branching enzyme [Blastocladiella emersonii ATCC 22665]|nr:alpha-1,4-glucan branching enzyme [Blastocladiella emersonii ATCC 22665]